MGRRGAGGRGSSAHGASSQGAPPPRASTRGQSAYDSPGYDAPQPRYGGGSMPQRGPGAQQGSWETLSSSAPPGPPAPPSEPPSRQRGRQRPQKKTGRGATYSVVVMTVASLFGVAVLAAQAAATAPQVSNTTTKNAGKTSGQPTANASGGSSAGGAAGQNALPANSGSGQRIVYAEAAKRVWLVSSGTSVARSFPVVPGTVAAPTGTFAVTNRLSAVTGTDGTPVQYVVLFNKAKVGGGSATAFGFDAVANVTGMPPAPASRTGGIRAAQDDAQALWNFSNLGTTVVVLP